MARHAIIAVHNMPICQGLARAAEKREMGPKRSSNAAIMSNGAASMCPLKRSRPPKGPCQQNSRCWLLSIAAGRLVVVFTTLLCAKYEMQRVHAGELVCRALALQTNSPGTDRSLAPRGGASDIGGASESIIGYTTLKCMHQYVYYHQAPTCSGWSARGGGVRYRVHAAGRHARTAAACNTLSGHVESPFRGASNLRCALPGRWC
jgi:hypothetical protein